MGFGARKGELVAVIGYEKNCLDDVERVSNVT